jgi:hypothetical protein
MRISSDSFRNSKRSPHRAVGIRVVRVLLTEDTPHNCCEQCGTLTGLQRSPKGAKTTLVVQLCGYLGIRIIALALTSPPRILTILPKHHELWSELAGAGRELLRKISLRYYRFLLFSCLPCFKSTLNGSVGNRVVKRKCYSWLLPFPELSSPL